MDTYSDRIRVPRLYLQPEAERAQSVLPLVLFPAPLRAEGGYRGEDPRVLGTR